MTKSSLVSLQMGTFPTLNLTTQNLESSLTGKFPHLAGRAALDLLQRVFLNRASPTHLHALAEIIEDKTDQILPFGLIS